MMDESSSSSAPSPVPPEIIIRILEFIPNRTDWNSIARCNRDIYEKSKAYLPPWPTNYKLSVPADYGPDHSNYGIYRPAWSPDGTQIACSFASKIIIFDQRHGLLRFRHNGDNNGNNNNSNIMTPFLILQMFAHDPMNATDIHLIYSPDGSLLVALTAGLDARVKICVYTTDGYYRQLQEWNLHAYWEGGWYTNLHIDISPCSKYVAVIVDNQILLKDINNGETIKSIVIAEHHIRKVMFCRNDDQCSIFIHLEDNETNEKSLKIWFPYDNIDNEDEDDPNTTASLIIVWEPQPPDGTFVLSHDNSMIVYREQNSITSYDDVMLYSIDNDTKSATLKQSFRLAHRSPSIYFTPDDKYILYTKNKKLAFLNIKTGRDITDPIQTTYNTKQRNRMLDYNTQPRPFVYFSPAGGTIRRFLVSDNTDKFFYIASYWEK
jgi:Tol biopolymer transport system component